MPLKALGRKFLDESYVISGIEAAKSTSIADATVSFALFVDGLQITVSLSLLRRHP